MRYDVVAIQEFIAQFFSDEELGNFCITHFEEAVADLAPEMGLRKKAAVLVGYCKRRGELPGLLAELEAARAKPFAEYRAKLAKGVETRTPGVLPPAPARPSFERWRVVGSDEYRLAAIRSLVRDAFTSEELVRFCQGRPLFLPLLGWFSSGAGLEVMIDFLLDYCRVRLLFPELLWGIQEVNPRQFERHEARL